MSEPKTDPPQHRYARAALYAMDKHRNQVRRDGSPYIQHPLRVAESLRSIGGIRDMDVVLAALMHDLIEDTDCEWADLARRFGERVANLVSAVSGDMRLPKKERRAEVIERIRGAPTEAKAIRLADRLDNLTDMVGFSESRQQEYLEESEKVLEACKGGNAPLEKALEAVILKLKGRHS